MQWIAKTRRGGYIPQYANGKEQDVFELLGRDLEEFRLVDNGPALIQHFDEHQRLMYDACGRQGHLLGWRQFIKKEQVLEHHVHYSSQGVIETGGRALSDQMGRAERQLSSMPRAYFQFRPVDCEELRQASGLPGAVGPQPRFGWAVAYREGEILTQWDPAAGKTRSIAEIDRRRIDWFALVADNTGKPLLIQYMLPGQRLIYRRRTALRQNVRTADQSHAICQMVGWRRDINGREIQHVAYCHESTNLIEMAGKFREGTEWMRPTVDYDYELVAVG